MAKGGDLFIGLIVGGIIGGLVTFIGYEKINTVLGGKSVSRYGRRGYFTNHLDIYPFRPASLY